jgi:hypothetical protein
MPVVYSLATIRAALNAAWVNVKTGEVELVGAG